MDKVQGYFVLCDNDPSGRALWYYHLQAAKDAKASHEASLDRWPKGWNMEYWKTKPTGFSIYEAHLGEKIDG